ncbi:uncharacterized protein BDR25DRAFT_392696 [Lindgomyces ingoldianus]|uniref:Uncharacterized protein n=1 Tax=Lindgomyces ingoldianus TaxID=673940 RepID=A0ACB6R3D6_9PLEO|nr:uncharacterized protein BDR25DRAFT_392696 [Lindgomyces ingoldianus]KAF2472837.1 hypothetical protein BDR25DRAFT_392696 [Lindgomyces ingoldianus]
MQQTKCVYQTESRRGEIVSKGILKSRRILPFDGLSLFVACSEMRKNKRHVLSLIGPFHFERRIDGGTSRPSYLVSAYTTNKTLCFINTGNFNNKKNSLILPFEACMEPYRLNLSLIDIVLALTKEETYFRNHNSPCKFTFPLSLCSQFIKPTDIPAGESTSNFVWVSSGPLIQLSHFLYENPHYHLFKYLSPITAGSLYQQSLAKNSLWTLPRLIDIGVSYWIEYIEYVT